MADKISGTNTSPPDPNMMITGDTAPPKIDPPKVDAPMAEPKEEGYFDSMLDGVKSRAVGYAEQFAEKSASVSKDILTAADQAVDFVADTSVGKVLAPVAMMDDLTDMALATHEHLIENGGSPYDLVAGFPEALERVVDRTNASLEETLGPDFPKLAKNLDEVCWGTTADMMTNPANIPKLLAGATALSIEILAENDENIKRVLDSNTSEYYGDLADVAASAADVTLAVAFWPVALYSAYTGEGVASSLLEFSKETIAELSKPDTMRDLHRVAHGPSEKMIEELPENGVYSSTQYISLEFKAGKGGEIEGRIDRTVRPTKDGQFEVTTKIDPKLAVALGLQKVGDISAKAGVDLEFKVIYPDAGSAARAARMDPTGYSLKAMAEGLDSLKGGVSGGVGAEVLDVIDFDIMNRRGVDLAQGNAEFGTQIKGAFDATSPLSVTATHRDQPDMTSACAVLAEVTRPDFGFKAEVTAQGTFVAGADGLKYNLQYKAELERPNASFTADLQIEIDLVKAAQAIGIGVLQLKEQVTSGKLDPETWWKDLPNDAVKVIPKFEAVTHGTLIGVKTPLFGAHAKVSQEHKFNAEEAMNFLHGLAAEDRRHTAIRG